MIYAARNWDDILYKDAVLECMNYLPNLRVSIYLSDHDLTQKLPEVERVQFFLKRLQESDLSKFDENSTVAYLCGPPKLSDAINLWMKNADINYEKWW